MGAEAAIIAPYLSEFVGAKSIAVGFTASLAAFFSFGFGNLGLSWVTRWSQTSKMDGVMHLSSQALPVVFVLWWRQALRGSPRWLVSRGRTDEADAIVNSIEAEFQARGIPLPSPEPELLKAQIAPGNFIRRTSKHYGHLKSAA